MIVVPTNDFKVAKENPVTDAQEVIEQGHRDENGQRAFFQGIKTEREENC